MKKFTKILLVIALIFSISFITGCDKKEENEANTVALKLVDAFKKEIKNEKDLEKVAKSISENSNIKIAVDVTEIKDETYISGLTTEISGYKKAYAIRPIIGSIPFVAYIFEVEDAKSFEKTLRDNADKRWNICTEADSMESAVVDNYVFFVMSPDTFE